MHPPTVLLTNPPQPLQQPLSVDIILMDQLPVITCVHHVANRTCRIPSQRSSHGREARGTTNRLPTSNYKDRPKCESTTTVPAVGKHAQGRQMLIHRWDRESLLSGGIPRWRVVEGELPENIENISPAHIRRKSRMARIARRTETPGIELFFGKQMRPMRRYFLHQLLHAFQHDPRTVSLCVINRTSGIKHIRSNSEFSSWNPGIIGRQDRYDP